MSPERFPSENVDAVELLRARLRLFHSFLFALSVALLAARWFIIRQRGGDPLDPVTTASYVPQVAFTAAAGLTLLLVRLRRLNRYALQVVDAGSMCAIGVLAGCVLFPLPVHFRPELGILLGLAHLLVGRAALVPSTALRTLSVGAISLLPVLVATYVVASREGAPEWLATPSAQLFTAVVWASAMLGLSTVVSRVIYRLRRKVGQAMHLGQYKVERLIGKGGMGTVYLARHALLRRPTALKVLESDAASEAAIARFEREVQATSQLSHPNTVAIYDYGRTPDARFYYAMEYLDGLDLATLVSKYGPQPPARVAHILCQVCEALVEVHSRGLVHRDIKPANIMLCERGLRPDFVKVLDFGLVRGHETDTPRLSGDDRVHGTPLYMAPEAITRPGNVDARVDIYAIGALAYFLLAGRAPLEGATITEVLARQVQDLPQPPSSPLGQELPQSLVALVLACLEKDPAHRPASMVELLAAIEALDLGPWTVASARAWWREHAQTEDAAVSSEETSGVPPLVVAIDMDRRGEAGLESTLSVAVPRRPRG